jgi:hypothetical protein
MRGFTAGLTALVAVAVAGPNLRADENAFGDANAQPAPFNPQMSALMSMLIQPRHAKLGLAGRAENWPLASYELKELRQAFSITARAVPRWQGSSVPDLLESAIEQPLKFADIATKTKFKGVFDQAYEALTQACNNCHATTDRSFIVIKAPDTSAFPNQDFGQKR